MTIYLGPQLLSGSSDSPSTTFYKVVLDTILHRGKDLAVSAGLNRVVSVRTYILPHAGVTRYLAPSPTL